MQNNVKVAVPVAITQKQIEEMGQRVMGEMVHDFTLKTGIPKGDVQTKFADKKYNLKKLADDFGERLSEDLILWLRFTTGLKTSTNLFWSWTKPKPSVQMLLIDYIRLCEHVRTKYLEEFGRFCREENDKSLVNVVKNNLWVALEYINPQQAGKILLFLESKAQFPIEELPVIRYGLYGYVQKWLQGRILLIPGKSSKSNDDHFADFIDGKF